MSQLGNTTCLSQSYSTWPSKPLGSGFRVIFIYSLVFVFLSVPSPRLLSVFSLFVCISPSISVPVLLLAVGRLTDGPLFAVRSYLSGGGVMCLEWLLPSSMWLSRGWFSSRSRLGLNPTPCLNSRQFDCA